MALIFQSQAESLVSAICTANDLFKSWGFSPLPLQSYLRALQENYSERQLLLPPSNSSSSTEGGGLSSRSSPDAAADAVTIPLEMCGEIYHQP